MTSIEWTDETWNPTTGCDRTSPGCDNCYALTMARRLKALGQTKYQRDGAASTSGPGFGISEHWDALTEPLRWRKPRRVFVNSMSDLFHAGVSREFLASVWAVMAATPQHTYQVLTKRHARMRSVLRDECTCHAHGTHFWSAMSWAASSNNPRHVPGLTPDMVRGRSGPLPNVWLGVSVEDQKRADLRIPALLDTPAAVRFLSCEPLLGPVDLGRYAYGLEGLHWVIAGGESGPRARPMHPDWARVLRDQCAAAQVPFFFKQWGAWTEERQPGRESVLLDYQGAGRIWAHRHQAVELWRAKGKHDTGRQLDGRTHDDFPLPAVEEAARA